MLRAICLGLFLSVGNNANAFERSEGGDRQLVEIAEKALGYRPPGEVHITHEGKLIRVTFGEPIYSVGTKTVVPDGTPPSVLIDPFNDTPQVKEVYHGL